MFQGGTYNGLAGTITCVSFCHRYQKLQPAIPEKLVKLLMKVGCQQLGSSCLQTVFIIQYRECVYKSGSKQYLDFCCKFAFQ